MRIGIVCPYSFDVPGGVQRHVHDLAEALLAQEHQVSVLAPADEDAPLPSYVVPAGRAVPVRYNGSVARLAFGPLTATRVRRWLTSGEFDVIHVHEPFTPSLSLLAVLAARDEPVVATFHTAITRSRTMHAVSGVLQLVLERLTARIAVSSAARKVQVEHLGGDAWVIPNGVPVARYASAQPLPGWPGSGGAIGFLGRFTEPRKGFPVLRDAFAALAASRPDLRLLVAGPGDPEEALTGVPPSVVSRMTFLGLVDEQRKAQMLRSVDAYVAPNVGGESFGMILTEAMAAGTPVVASDLEAFRRVLDDAGELFATGSAPELARVLGEVLDDPDRRATMAAHGREVVAPYDWAEVSRRILEVYHLAIEAAPRPPRSVRPQARPRPRNPVLPARLRWS